jgi:hypothetical protein
MTAGPRTYYPLKLAAPLTCPSCGREFMGHWIEDRETADQQCPACGHVFEATWPGFPFEPETVIVGPDGKVPGHAAA